MSRPLLLDLFCCAGGAAEGYQRAGFDVLGVDVVEHPAYPGPQLVTDWRSPLADASLMRRVAAVHASPPCQKYTQISVKHRGNGTLADERVGLIPDVLDALSKIGRPWVVENVVGARVDMPSAVLLSGGMFGLGVHRPRLFATSFLLMAPPTAPIPSNAVGVYGRHHDGRLLWRRKDGTELRCASSVEEARVAMGLRPGLTWREICESIPPAYTEHVGRQLMRAL